LSEHFGATIRLRKTLLKDHMVTTHKTTSNRKPPIKSIRKPHRPNSVIGGTLEVNGKPKEKKH